MYLYSISKIVLNAQEDIIRISSFISLKMFLINSFSEDTSGFAPVSLIERRWNGSARKQLKEIVVI